MIARNAFLSLAAFALVWAASAHAAPVIVGTGVANEGVTTDLFDIAQGGLPGRSTPVVTNFESSKIIGFSNALGENGQHTIFADGNGPAGFVDQFFFAVPSASDIDTINLILSQDGVSANRSAISARLFASSNGITFTEVSDTTDTSVSLSNYDTNFGSGSISITDNINLKDAQFFRLDIERAVNGPRLRELDGFGGDTSRLSQAFLQENLFNAKTNSVGDEPAGRGINFTFSSAVLGTDTVEDAFGNNDGAVEAPTFIFGDGGVADNGNAILGDGGETVDFIQWQTDKLIELAGFQITLGGDGDGAQRDTELVRFLVEGNEVDFFDANGVNGTLNRLFLGGPVIGNDFRIEFTRSSLFGPRIFEINAIITPEPAALLTWLTVGLLLWGARRRRVR